MCITSVPVGTPDGPPPRIDSTRARLTAHFAAESTEHVIGAHVASPDERCRWIALDIDKHGDESREANFRFALRIYRRARKAGLTVLLIDSSGGLGGYHLWVLFDRQIALADARRLVLWLVRGWRRAGLPRRPDLFPGNDVLTGKRYGTWLRLPGRHHTRPSWSLIWSPDEEIWVEGEEACQTDPLRPRQGRGRRVDRAGRVSKGKKSQEATTPLLHPP